MARKPKSFDVQSFIICDDVRRESNGKDFLIGVYGDTILFPQFPAGLTMLSMRVAFIPRAPGKVGAFKVVDGKGVQRGAGGGALPSKMEIGRLATLTFVMRNVVFQTPTTLIFSFGIDGQLLQLGQIEVRAAANDEEKARVSNRT